MLIINLFRFTLAFAERSNSPTPTAQFLPVFSCKIYNDIELVHLHITLILTRFILSPIQSSFFLSTYDLFDIISSLVIFIIMTSNYNIFCCPLKILLWHQKKVTMPMTLNIREPIFMQTSEKYVVIWSLKIHQRIRFHLCILCNIFSIV